MQPTPTDSPRFSHFTAVACAFVAVLMISNTVATKLIAFGPFVETGAIFIFPLTYIFGDILTEVYGYRASRRIIWIGVGTQLLMSASYYLIMLLPTAPFWPHQGAYEAILGVVPRIVAASLIGYFGGEFTNSIILSRMKVWTRGRHLWTRTIGSTVVGQVVDTGLFVSIAFAGVIPSWALVAAATSGYLSKVAIEAAFTPVTYAMVRWLKRSEGVDTFDYHVNYNPFKLQENQN